MLIKKFFAVTIILLTFALVCLAQDTTQITDWRTLNFSDLEFSVQVPEYFEFKKNIPEPKKKLDQFKSRGEFQSDDERFYLFVDSVDKNEQFRNVMSFIESNVASDKMYDLMQKNSGKAEFLDNDGYYHRVRFFKLLTRTITLQTVSTQQDNGAASRFLNSFTFFPKKKNEPETTAKPAPLNPGDDITADSGEDSKQPTSKVKPPVTQVKSSYVPMSLKSKPKALYTKFAVFYNIQGVVRTRVTFGRDGNVGAITVVKKLPFGLVNSSENAAKNMTFIPAERDGKPITLTRLVEYSFTIY